MPSVQEAMSEIGASCLQLHKAWKLAKDKSKAEWERWSKGKSAAFIATEQAAYDLLVFDEGLGKMLEGWHKTGKSYASFHAHHVKIHKIQVRYHRLLKTALKSMKECKKVCTLLIQELDEQTQITDDWLETAKLVYESDVDAASKQSKEETDAVEKGKISPPIVLISLPVATVLKNAGLKADQIERIDIGGTLEVILSQKEIREEFAKKEVDVSALAKLTNSAALGVISAQIKQEAVALLDQLDDEKITEDQAEALFSKAVETAVEDAIARAVQEAERLSSLKSIAKYANVKSTFKVVALAIGVGAGATAAIGGGITVNPGLIAVGLYSSYKAVNKLITEVRRLQIDFDATIDLLQKAITRLGTSHGKLKEIGNSTINEFIGNNIKPTINELLELYASAVDKLARREAATDQVSKRLDGMLNRSDALSGKIAKMLKQMKDSEIPVNQDVTDLRTSADDLADQINLSIIEVIGLNEQVEKMREALESVQGEVSELRANVGNAGLYVAMAVSTGLSAGAVAGLSFAAEMAGATSRVCNLISTGVSAGNKTMTAAQAVTGYLKDKHSERAKTKLA